MQQQIGAIPNGTRPALLLHACCAPCASFCIPRLVKDFDLTVLFYNPNITDQNEYNLRLTNLIKLIDCLNIEYDLPTKIKLVYPPSVCSDEFYAVSKGLESVVEGGIRCEKCFKLRLDYTHKFAIKEGFEYFATTLTVSPHKNSQLINSIGCSLSSDNQVKYLYSDFKKNDGYKQSIINSNKYDLYRQNYCGCEYSKFET